MFGSQEKHAWVVEENKFPRVVKRCNLIRLETYRKINKLGNGFSYSIPLLHFKVPNNRRI